MYMAQDKQQKSIAKLKTALKHGKGVAKDLQSVKKLLQNLRKESKRLMKR